MSSLPFKKAVLGKKRFFFRTKTWVWACNFDAKSLFSGQSLVNGES
jgi:hypothetical protein